MRKLTKFALLFAFLLPVANANGAEETFRNIDSRAGLCDNSVNSIRQDNSGMLWFATWNGLCRYDGLLFYTFRHEFGNDNSIINNRVNKLEITNDGLYASTQGGLDYLSFTTGRFERCKVVSADGSRHVMTQCMTSMVKSGGRIVAADTGGKVYVSGADGQPELFRASPLRQKIVAVCAYRGGLLLGTGPDGVYIISSDARKVLASLTVSIDGGDKTTAYFSHQSNMLFVGHGIGRPTDAFAVSGKRIQRAVMALPPDVMDMTDCRLGTVFATDGGGLSVIRGGSLTTLSPQNSNLCGDALYSVLNDKDGNLWIGSYRMGLSMMPSRKPWWSITGMGNGQLTYKIVTAVVPDGDKIYVGLDGGGLNIIDRSSGRLIKAVSPCGGSKPCDNVVSMAKDERSLYMAVFTVGLVRMSLSDGSMRTYSMPPARGYNTNEVWVIHDDGQGRLWVGGPDVCLFNKATGSVKAIPQLRGKNCSAISGHGRYVYISFTHDGIYKVDCRTLRIVAHYSSRSGGKLRLPTDDVKYVYADSRGTVWFTSESSGFYAINEKKGTLTRFGNAEGLTSHFVTSMTEDHSGNIWLGTLDGLFRYCLRTRMFVRFDEDTELPSCYTYNASCLYDGTVYMGSIGGLVSFRPDSVNTKASHGRVGFIALRLLNDSQRELPLFGSEPEGVILKHSQNFFTVSFAVPDMLSPGRTQFACRLDGLESKWRELAERREVSYTNVPPGHYKLYVRCTDSNGLWSAPSILEITITPPWYATTLARILWTLLIILSAVAGAWLYLHEMAVKNNMRISQIEKDAQRKLYEAKMDFYTNITHELRTSVFLIAALIEELLEAHKSVLQVPASYLQTMYRSAKKLNSLVNRVIEMRKLDSGALKLELARQDVAAFCRNLTEDYEELCAQKNISFDFNGPQNALPLAFDPEKLEMMLSNLVSNAFKYTKEGGHVVMTVAEESDRVVFSVKDNGIGIMDKMKETIFESFFRTERAKRQSGGDGLGLSFVKQLVELHGGQISVESEVNVGSTFTFFIPKRPAGSEAAQDIPAQEPASDDLHDEPASGSDLLVQDIPLAEPSRTEGDGGGLPPNPTATHSVLVIDDERATVSLIERALCANYVVYKAYDGEEGLAIARRRLPDIIVCDIMMPKMDGLALLSAVKNDKTLKHIKVIIFTAKSAEEDMLTAYDSGADSYLTKPISLKLLRARVDQLATQDTDTLLPDALMGNGKKTYNKEERVFLVRCRGVIDDNISSPDFSIELMADKLAMSHSALYKRIKSITGLSLISFINDYKIYKAVQLFRQGCTSVDEVSRLCGFHDAKNFREMFKRKMKMTPKQFVLSL